MAPLEILIDLLANFGFPELTDEFLAGMKAELPEVIRNAKQPFDYPEMEGVAEYDAALVQAPAQTHRRRRSRRRSGRPGRPRSRPRSGRRAGAGFDVQHVGG